MGARQSLPDQRPNNCSAERVSTVWMALDSTWSMGTWGLNGMVGDGAAGAMVAVVVAVI